MVGEYVNREVNAIFVNQKVPDYLNQILIALIPKRIGSESVRHYRPISLCNAAYKIISKSLT